jgi:RNA polymerase sigma-70 factor (ECF subfamily)
MTDSRNDPGDRAQPPADEELVADAVAGSADAFRRLVERHQDRVYGVALRLLRNPDEALDAAQDVFVRAWKALARFESRSRVSTWFYRIAVNVCYDRLGRRRRGREVPLDDLLESGFEPVAGGGTEGEESLSDSQAQRAFEAAVAALEPTYRAAFVLRQIEGRPYDEVAEALGITLTNAKVRVHRAREKIVEMLRKRGVLS